MLSRMQRSVLQAYMRSNAIQPTAYWNRSHSVQTPTRPESLQADLITHHYSSPRQASIFPASADSIPFDPLSAYLDLRDALPLHSANPSPFAQLNPEVLERLVHDITLEAFVHHPLVINAVQEDLLHAPAVLRTTGLAAIRSALQEISKTQEEASVKKRLQRQLERLDNAREAVKEVRVDKARWGQAFMRIQKMMGTDETGREGRTALE